MIEWAIRFTTRSSFFREGIGYTQDSTCLVLYADQESPAGSIRECDERADHPVGRGQIALELESFTLGAGEQGERIRGRKFTRKNSESHRFRVTFRRENCPFLGTRAGNLLCRGRK